MVAQNSYSPTYGKTQDYLRKKYPGYPGVITSDYSGMSQKGPAQPPNGVFPYSPNTNTRPNTEQVADVVDRPQSPSPGGAGYYSRPDPVNVEPKAIGTTTQPTGSPIGVTTRPISAAVQTILDDLRAKASAMPTSAEQIMASPEYQSQKRVIDLNRGMAQAALKRSLASRNWLQSTPAIQALANSDALYTGQEDALVPQLLTAATARQRQSIADTEALLRAQTGVEDTAFSQGITQFNTEAPYNYLTKSQETEALGKYNGQWTQKGRGNEAALGGLDPVTGLPTYGIAVENEKRTGKFVSPAAQGAINTILDAKKNYASDPAKYGPAASEARAELQRQGIDPALFGADVTYDQAVKNALDYGWTLGGRKDSAELTGIDPVTGGPDYRAAVDQEKATGKFVPPAVRSAISSILDAKKNYDADPAKYGPAADAARTELFKWGVDPALFGADVTYDQAVLNAQNLGWTLEGQKTQAELTGKNPVTGEETPTSKLQRLQTEREQLLINQQTLKNEVDNNPDYGLRAQADVKMRENEKNLMKLDADIDATKALAEDRRKPPTPQKPSLGAQRNEIRSTIAGWMSAGNTFEQVSRALREHAGDLGDVGLDDALSDAAAIYGIKKPNSTQAETEAMNSFASEVVIFKGRGLDYGQALEALDRKVGAGALVGMTYAQARDTIDRVYGKGRYEE